MAAFSTATVLAIAAITASVAAAGVSAYGASKAADAQSQTANYQAQVAANNAKQAGVNATYAKQAGAVTEQNQRLKTAALIGSQRAAQGANGLDLNSGSASDIQDGTQLSGDVDALSIRANAGRAAYGYEVQGAGFKADEGLDKARAGYAQAAGNIGVATSILGGASSVSDKWAKYQQAGAFSGQPSITKNTPGGP